MNDKFLKKIVKQNYNNQLEKILSKKPFSEDVKNSLLNIFYKIESGYEDYKNIKRNTFDKKEYIEKLIKIIEKDCEKIEFIKPKESEVVKDNEIYCYPIETRLLYSLAKVQNRSKIVSYLDESIEKAISNVLNTGNNINMVEPLRDFNGFSWNIIKKDIENLTCNILYQNILYIAGNKFIDKWVNNYDSLVDYFELFQNNIEKKYGKEAKENIISKITQIAILNYALNNEEYKEEIEEKEETLEEENNRFQDIEEYIIQITKQKKKKEKEIKKLDLILNNKEMLIKEYEKRNKKLPLEKKIFSTRTLKKIIKKERAELLQEIKDNNKKIRPEVFLKERENTQQKLEYLGISKIEDLKKEINKKIIDLQKEIIKCMYIDLKNVNEKNEIMNMLYLFRYYNLLPVSSKKSIYNIKEINESLKKLTKCILTKLVHENFITKIFKKEELNYNIIEKITLSKIICFEKLNVEIIEEKNEFYLIIFDEEIEEDKIKLENITKDEINIKFNKKIKLFKI